MDIVFRAIEDIKKGEFVKLDIASGELSTVTQKDMDEFNAAQPEFAIKFQPKEEPNIIEAKVDPLEGLMI